MWLTPNATENCHWQQNFLRATKIPQTSNILRNFFAKEFISYLAFYCTEQTKQINCAYIFEIYIRSWFVQCNMLLDKFLNHGPICQCARDIWPSVCGLFMCSKHDHNACRVYSWSGQFGIIFSLKYMDWWVLLEFMMHILFIAHASYIQISSVLQKYFHSESSFDLLEFTDTLEYYKNPFNKMPQSEWIDLWYSPVNDICKMKSPLFSFFIQSPNGKQLIVE